MKRRVSEKRPQMGRIAGTVVLKNGEVARGYFEYPIKRKFNVTDEYTLTLLHLFDRDPSEVIDEAMLARKENHVKRVYKSDKFDIQAYNTSHDGVFITFMMNQFDLRQRRQYKGVDDEDTVPEDWVDAGGNKWIHQKGSDAYHMNCDTKPFYKYQFITSPDSLDQVKQDLIVVKK